MECLTGEQKWSQFVQKYFSDIRAPFTAGMELLPQCNFQCVHCYAASERISRIDSLSTEKILNIIDILFEHNCVELYFTGGECLLHKDFFEIYKYAKKKGIFVAVLTNGSLITQKHIELWLEYPPELVSITLYGASENTYEAITGSKENFHKVMQSIALLQKNHIRFELKIIGMQQNYQDIPEMRNFIRKCGQVNSILAWDIRPMNNGNTSPISCRVTPEQAMEVEINDPERKAFFNHLARNIDKISKTERQKGHYLYPCAAGYQFAFITHDGHMQSCVKTVTPRYDLIHGNFDEGWEFLGKEFVEKKASSNFKCLNCDKFRYCGQCSAAFMNENGDPEKPVKFYCDLGELRKQYMFKVHQFSSKDVP